MKRLLPGRLELTVFALIAVVLSLIVSRLQVSQHDIGFAALAAPVFVFAAVLGLRRSPQWQTAAQSISSDTEPDSKLPA